MKELILKNFPDLNHHELLKGIETYGKLKTIESGEVMMEVGRWLMSIWVYMIWLNYLKELHLLKKNHYRCDNNDNGDCVAIVL